MKGPSIDDQSCSPGSNFGLYHQNQLVQNQAANSQQRFLNVNQNNSDSLTSYGSHVNMMGYQNVQPAHQEQPADDPFAEYAWMGDEDEFDRQVMEQMEQDEFFESCVRQLCDDQEECNYFANISSQADQFVSQVENERMSRLTITETPPTSVLNPNAVEFVPRWVVKQQ